MSRAEWVVGAMAVAVIGSYAAIYRALLARRRAALALPAAMIKSGAPRWLRGQGEQDGLGTRARRWAQSSHPESGLAVVALAFTSIGIMTVCGIGIAAVWIVGAVTQ